MQKEKINLAVVFYGDKGQLRINQQQFEELAEVLTDFHLEKYDFNQGEQMKLWRDFRTKKIDLVLKNSYGRGNESYIESFLELNRIPFLGSDARSTFIGTSKFLSKQLFHLYGLPVAKDVFIDKFIWAKSKNKILSAVKNRIGFPVVIKDVGGTDSRGIYYIKTQEQCGKVLDNVIDQYQGVIIEEYIEDSYETTCMVIGSKNPKPYEPVGIGNEIGNLFSEKKKDDMSFTLEVPMSLGKTTIQKIKRIAVSAHQALGCKTFSRSDILVKAGKLYLLEVDVHPGFRVKSPTFLSAQYAGQSPNDLFLEFKMYIYDKKFAMNRLLLDFDLTPKIVTISQLNARCYFNFLRVKL